MARQRMQLKSSRKQKPKKRAGRRKADPLEHVYVRDHSDSPKNRSGRFDFDTTTVSIVQPNDVGVHLDPLRLLANKSETMLRVHTGRFCRIEVHPVSVNEILLKVVPIEEPR